jgi:hypothetical protein
VTIGVGDLYCLLVSCGLGDGEEDVCIGGTGAAGRGERGSVEESAEAVCQLLGEYSAEFGQCALGSE